MEAISIRGAAGSSAAVVNASTGRDRRVRPDMLNYSYMLDACVEAWPNKLRRARPTLLRLMAFRSTVALACPCHRLDRPEIEGLRHITTARRALLGSVGCPNSPRRCRPLGNPCQSFKSLGDLGCAGSEPQGPANIIWGCGQMSLREPALTMAIRGLRGVGQMTMLCPLSVCRGTVRATASGLSPQNIANAAWALVLA